MGWFYRDGNGYKRIKKTGQLVHRRVAEKKIGRSLKPWEVAHHINRNKSDNRASNIWVFGNQNKHYTTHKRDKRRTGYW